jgi:protein arginine kinase
MYQLSNQITLGLSEAELINNIKTVVSKIIEQERLARKHLLNDAIGLEDRIYRAYGIVSNARILSSSECNKLLSDINYSIYNSLFFYLVNLYKYIHVILLFRFSNNLIVIAIH